MASITYNGESSPEKMVTFTEVPNILKVSNTIYGDKATIEIDFDGDLRSATSADSQYYITFMGDSVTNVMNPKNNNNKRFYISGDEDSTAMNVARAMRCCPAITTEFDVIHNGNGIYLLAKSIGEKWSDFSNVFLTNIPNTYMTVSATSGSSSSFYYNSKIDVDVFSGSTSDYENYITTLEKNFYGDECAFNMSPVLETMSEYGNTKPYTLSIQMVREDGEWQNIGEVSGLTTIGFKANQSENYLFADGVMLLGNVSRGNSGMTLYTYDNTILYSVLGGSARWSETLTVKNSAGVAIYTSGTTGSHPYGNNYIHDGGFEVPAMYMQRGNYIEVAIGTQVIRYNIITPLRATEYFQRIVWRNEYGGLFFFDFTGGRTESDSTDTETYEKNVFDYYDTNTYEKKKIYSIDYTKTVTLKSHLMDEDGRYIFNSLMRSKKVWTEVNGKTYYIIPKSISIEEDNTYNGIYVAKFTYEYSDI